MPRASHQTSGWEDALAAILGGLGGGLEGWQTGKRLERDEAARKDAADRQARNDARADADHALRMKDYDDRRRERQEHDTVSMLNELGRDAIVTPEQAGRARTAGLGHRVEGSVDFGQLAPVAGGPAPFFLPKRVERVAPTAAERKADRITSEKAAKAAADAAALDQAIGGLPEHLQPVARFGTASGKMPTLGSADFESPDVKGERAIEQEIRKRKALFPITMKERQAEKEMDRRYADMPIPLRDDASLPNGVRSYLGDLASRYQDDPAGARAELRAAAPKLLADHPRLDLVKVTQQINAMLPLPQLTDEEKDAAAAARAAARPAGQPAAAGAGAPTLPPSGAGAPSLATRGAPTARAATAAALMKQITEGRAAGKDTSALERQLLALKVGAGAAR